MWEYSHPHLSIENKDPVHCCCFGLGGSCDHSPMGKHNIIGCKKCLRCFRFSEYDVQLFLKSCLVMALTEDEITELKTMIDSIPKLQYGLKHYLAHRMRARVQFDAINEIKNNMKNNNSEMLLVIDHKQKILPIKYREGQVEYYGKKCMSLLGTMEVTWLQIASTDDNSVQVFKYEFADYVFEGYIGQDNIQVAAAIQTIIDQIHVGKPQIKEVIIQSETRLVLLLKI